MLKKNNKKVVACVPFNGGLNYISEYDKVFISGLGRRGRVVCDTPRVKYNCITVEGYSIKALYLGKRGKGWWRSHQFKWMVF